MIRLEPSTNSVEREVSHINHKNKLMIVHFQHLSMQANKTNKTKTCIDEIGYKFIRIKSN